MTRLLACLAAAVLLVEACGGSKHAAAPTTTGPTTTTAATSDNGPSNASTTTVLGPAVTTARGTTTTGAGASTTARAAGTSTTASTVPVTASADKACVHPAEQQGLTINGPSNADLIFDTVYSDNTSELTSKYGTGSGRGRTDGRGFFHVTWILSPRAPAGPARINYSIVNNQRFSRGDVPFLIKAVGQAC